MTRTHGTFLTACALLLSACSSIASQQPPELSPEHPILGMLETPLSQNTLTAEALMSARWQFPLTLAKSGTDQMSVENCNALLGAYEKDFGPSQPSEFGLVQANLALCLATADIQNLEPSANDYLPDPLLGPRFPMTAPAELAVAISDSQRDRAKESHTWQEFSALKDYQSRSPYDATYVTEDGAIQRVFLVATGDFNGDDSRDAILYLESALEQGSYGTTRYLIVTREEADGPMRVLKQVWPGE